MTIENNGYEGSGEENNENSNSGRNIPPQKPQPENLTNMLERDTANSIEKRAQLNAITKEALAKENEKRNPPNNEYTKMKAAILKKAKAEANAQNNEYTRMKKAMLARAKATGGSRKTQYKSRKSKKTKKSVRKSSKKTSKKH